MMIDVLQICNVRMVCICRGERERGVSLFMLQVFLVHLAYNHIVKKL